eukprot:m.242481 g.242481  ORF g.242481 m.242481 type:complete len:307 (+) comp34102_c0_seq1:18-938(+)
MASSSFVVPVCLLLLCVVVFAWADDDLNLTTQQGQPPFYVQFGETQRKTYLSPFDDGNKPNITEGGRKVNVRFGERFYIMLNAFHPHSSPNSSDFLQFDLVGKTLNVTVDLNGASCGCNAAMYLVSMPSSKPGANSDWYCDANNVGGNSCPEIDLIEANEHALFTTMHHCDKPYSSSTCAHGGYGARFGHGKSDLGNSSSFSIDTRRPFIFSTSFYNTQTKDNSNNSNNTEEKLSCAVSLYQDGSLRTQQVIDKVSNIADPLSTGMVMVFSFWGSSSMGWLDSPPCTNDTPHCPTFMSFSDMSVSK